LIWRAALSMILLGALSACDGRPRTLAFDGTPEAASSEKRSRRGETGHVLEFDLSASVPESPRGDWFFPLPATRTYTGLVRAVERARHDREAAGYFIRIGTRGLDWARAAELGRLFADLRATTGKPAVCHAHTLDNATAWVTASACDEVWMSPAGEASTVGLAGQAVYFRGLLEKLQIRAQFLSMGRYKSAVESFTRDDPSDATQEAMASVLGDLRTTWLDGMRVARAVPDLEATLEGGPWTAEESTVRRLIDAAGFEKDASSRIDELAQTSRRESAFGADTRRGGFDLAEMIRMIAGTEPSTRRPHIAVVPAEGSIAMSSGSVLSDGGITAGAMKKVLKRLGEQRAVRAVVLRIDSPGGSPLASDLIWHELMELRAKKPVIASIGEMAASGGYYIACAADRVVAEPTSIVGSIGVFGGKIVLGEALASLGVNTAIFAPSPDAQARARAAYLSPFVPWDPQTEDRVRTQMQGIYDLFIARVATGRRMTDAQVRSVADGRIWSGSQGKSQGLVDDLGGLARALELAREAAKLDADAPVRVEGTTESLLEMLTLGEGAEEADVQAAIRQVAERRARIMTRVAAPLRTFVGSLQGLTEGESVVAALPYGVILH
jgi:protease IV